MTHQWCFRHIGANFMEVLTENSNQQNSENISNNAKKKITKPATGDCSANDTNKNGNSDNQHIQPAQLDNWRQSIKLRRRQIDTNDQFCDNNATCSYSSIRKSTRIPYHKQKSLEMSAINEALEVDEEEGIEAFLSTQSRGRGIRTLRRFEQGEYIVSYRGELISKKQARERAASYANDSSLGSFMYYFTFQSRKYCIDATKDSPYLGRLVNHSFLRPNVVTRLHVDANNVPHIILVARIDIDAGVELQYNYGENDSETILNNPWLKST